MSNRVELTGWLVDAAELRHSPAGVPIARGLIEHESQQTEAGASRPIRFRVGVSAAGTPLAERLTDLPVGASIRVSGYMRRSRQRTPETDPIIISISRFERLQTTD
ncbi:primosomal replication protein N [Spiribacter vilamensis]|nr:primosomal replication protein N [Spiribacter vilamensis]